MVQQIYDENKEDEPEKLPEKPPEIPEGYSLCSLSGKIIPTENLALHQVHYERMQRRKEEWKKSEKERLEAHKIQNKSTTKLKKKPKNNHKLGTGKNKPQQEENIDDLMKFITEEDSEKPKVNHLDFLKNINNSGGHTTTQSRSKQIKQAQLKNKLNNKLSEMEKDRKGSKTKKK